MARSLAAACSAIGTRNSSAFSTPSSVRCRPTRRFMWFSDNYATHKHPRVRAWLTRHPRFTFHFTPTSCSWANAVEGWFAKLTRKRLKRGVFTSIVELQAAINRFIAEANDNSKPFVWTKSADAILAAVQRGRQALEAIH